MSDRPKKIQKYYIVVPEGLAADKKAMPLLKPSFIFRQVLDYVLQTVSPEDIVYLAPGNHFNSEQSEHEVAFDYIKSHNPGLKVLYPRIGTDSYIDTYGNALHLKKFLEHKIQSAIFELICAKVHSYRAEFCFEKAGFVLSQVHRVSCKILNEPVVGRVSYYKYKAAYIVYEIAAIIRDYIVVSIRHLL